ncbi:glycosyltransferase [Marinobacter sp.]|uniref:glycosyltransferase n=1 Tax=Marinobacter sp. TaxID=50741 RepID=UPI002B279DA9|nr:glycosyltransferase [Marinobacter sp.]
MKKPVLIVSILYKSRGGVGGMAQRFSYLGGYLTSRLDGFEVLTTKSLVDSLELKVNDKVKVIEDGGDLFSLKNFFVLSLVLSRILFRKYSQVHIAGAGRLIKIIMPLCKFSNTKVSCTFASRTLEMASYGDRNAKKQWVEVLEAVDAIDVLNPSHDLKGWAEKISVSPCSFPSKRNLIDACFSDMREETVVFCGALEKTKNPILALDIVDRYLELYGGGLSIVIFGSGSLKEQVENYAQKLNEKYVRNVVVFGEQSQLVSTLSKASVFFSLQEYDNYPSQSMMEAMLLGCKVIATDEGDTRLMLPKDEAMNAVVASRESEDFMFSLHAALSDSTASKINSKFIDESHSVERFSDYFCGFVGLKES